MTTKTNTGVGKMHPLDAAEFAEITITVDGEGLVSEADYICSGDPETTAAAEALCRLLPGKPAADLFQMNNNAVYYNLETDLPRDRLYCASIAVTAAKLAAADYCKKNGIPFDPGDCHCIV